MLEQLKAHLDDRISSVKVLMITALADDDDRLRGGIEGAVRYLVKPVSADELRAAVDDVLGGGPERDQRRQAQTGALQELARIQRGGDDPGAGRRRAGLASPGSSTPDPATTATSPTPPATSAAASPTSSAACCAPLAAAPSVSAAATDLGVSRSNVYASLRRIIRKTGHDVGARAAPAPARRAGRRRRLRSWTPRQALRGAAAPSRRPAR